MRHSQGIINMFTLKWLLAAAAIIIIWKMAQRFLAMKRADLLINLRLFLAATAIVIGWQLVLRHILNYWR
ncbi:MAG: hypothetical protein LBD82_02375 [Deltaproteobacteria bacterium]|nr:hypothetical protein [Deltaproteobacteria bacterium]